jgi:heptosyltransferase-2
MAQNLAIVKWERFTALIPGSAWEGKRWQGFADLAEILAKDGPVIVLGGKEESFCSEIAARAKKIAPESEAFLGTLSLGDCAYVLSRVKQIVGNDTGLVHLAEALGRDVVAIEGPTHPSQGYSVYRKKSAIVSTNLFCRPCSKNGHPCWRWGSRACLTRITPAEVAHQVRGRK